MQSASAKPSALVKPTLETHFHIDYAWWDRNTEEHLRTYLLSHLSIEQRERLAQAADDAIIDYVDPDTGEVFRMDALRVAIQQAAKDPNFINPHIAMVDAIFRTLLANGNRPLTPVEMAEAIGQDAGKILRTLSGSRVFKGIRPTESH